MNQLPAREPQYVSDEKFNWNRLLSLPLAKRIEVSHIVRLAQVHAGMDRFPDISFYQEEVNFDVMSTVSKAVIIRSGQGAWIDKQFIRNYTEAKKKGMKRGIYIFYDDRVSPQDHLKALQTVLDAYGLPEMEIWVDWENTYGGPHAGLKNVVALMQLIEEAYPTVEVGMYTGFWWFVEHSNPITNFFHYQYLKNKPLWLASYTNDVTHVRIPAPWTVSTWRHWQYGTPSIGHSMGVATAEIDMNLYMDDTVTWTERYGENNNQDKGDDMVETTLVVAELKLGAQSNLRNSYGTVGTTVLKTLTGPLTVVTKAAKISKDNYYWSEMVSPEEGWIAWTTSYTTPVPLNTTPTPIPNPTKKVTNVTIFNPGSVKIDYDDGTQDNY